MINHAKTILYVWKSPYPWDIRVEKICNSLIEHGYKVVVLAKYNNEKSNQEVTGKFLTIRFGSGLPQIATLPVPGNVLWQNAIEAALNQEKANIIIVREIMLAKQSSNIAKKYKIPVLMDMAENYPAAMKLWKKYRNGFINKLLIHKLNFPERLENNVVKQMDGIIVVCDEQVERLNQSFNYPLKKISVIHNTPPKSFKQNFEKSDKENITFMHHGYLSDEKKIDLFIEGFLLANKELKNLKLKIAGDGESCDELKREWKILGSPPSIEFLGKYDHHNLPKLLSNVDYGVLPYQVNQFNNFTLHNKIFDYFAYGKPVLLSKTTPFIRIEEQTKACMTVNCADAIDISNGIKELIQKDYNTLSKNAESAFYNKYNWEEDSRNLINFVQNYI